MTCVRQGDLCNTALCGDCMTCQFTLFNSIPAHSKPTDAVVQGMVAGVCAVVSDDSPMTVKDMQKRALDTSYQQPEV